MSESVDPCRNEDARLSEALKSCALLALAVLGFYPLVAGYGYSQFGTMGVASASVAAGLCFAGAAAALMCIAFLQGPTAAVNSTLLGMLFRMGLPLGGAMVLNQSGGPLVAAGVVGMVLVYYLFTLVIETLLSLSLVKRQSAKQSPPVVGAP